MPKCSNLEAITYFTHFLECSLFGWIVTSEEFVSASLLSLFKDDKIRDRGQEIEKLVKDNKLVEPNQRTLRHAVPQDRTKNEAFAKVRKLREDDVEEKKSIAKV